MTLDIKNLVQLAAIKANQVDSNTDAATLEGYLNFLERQGLGSVMKYSNEASFPLVVNEETKRLAINEEYGTVYFRSSEGWRGTEFPQYIGTTAGFWAGGGTLPQAGADKITKIAFASDTATGEHGTLLEGTYTASGTSSATNAYVIGGSWSPNPVADKRFSKFSFASTTPVTVTPLASHPQGAHRKLASASDIGGGKGYHTNQSPDPSNPSTGNRWAHPFAADVPFTLQTGTMGVARLKNSQGASSDVKGYSMGGLNVPVNSPPTTSTDEIRSFPFASDVDATAATATLTEEKHDAASTTGNDGFVYVIAGDLDPGAPTNFSAVIERFPFANENTSTSVGTANPGTNDNAAACSSIASVYVNSGGANYDKFNYGASVTVTNVVDLTPNPALTRTDKPSGHQF